MKLSKIKFRKQLSEPCCYPNEEDLAEEITDERAIKNSVPKGEML